ncbi:MAG TPA: amidase [Gemmatimonadaceae bacterium]|nr:amidase [Gemmatimonadaceae bacterium]
MRRRDFLRASAISAAALGVGDTAEAETLSRMAGGERSGGFVVPEFELEEATIVDLQRDMVSGKRSSHDITVAYLERIAAMDRRGPALHSVIETNPDAIAIADALDRERRDRGQRGPLHGIPVLIKDNIDTADRMTTTAGSLALEGSIPLRDSHVALRLRQAGAVILGKTNMSEWANFRSTHSSSGWSARGGQAKNPYILDRNPCGSSSGSGAATSANFAAVSVGTETDGSVVCPSSANGLVGIKPTLGLVSRSGIIPIAHSQDTAGPMTRTVADAAILLTALAGIDSGDSATAASKGHIRPDYTKFLNVDGLKGARIGVMREKYFGFNDSVDALMETAVRDIKRLGATVVDPINIPTNGKYDDTEMEVLLYEFKADLNAYLKSLGPKAPVKTMAEVIAFNERNKALEMPYFAQELMVRSQAKGPLTEKKYRDALTKNHRMSRTEGIDGVMIRHKLDAIITVTGGPAWVTDLVNGDHYTGGYSTASAVAGYPHITVPVGMAFGLPCGMSIFGRAWSEHRLISIAYAYEQATKHRRAPRFLPTLDTENALTGRT